MDETLKKNNPARESSVSRRALLVAAPAASLAAFVSNGMIIGAATHDPLPGWLAAWKHNRAAWHDVEPESAEEQRLWKDSEAIERRILSERAVSPQGIAAQIDYALQEGLCGEQMGGEFQGLDRQMFEGIVETLRGMECWAGR